MSAIFEDITAVVGYTPLVKINKLGSGKATIHPLKEKVYEGMHGKPNPVSEHLYINSIEVLKARA